MAKNLRLILPLLIPFLLTTLACQAVSRALFPEAHPPTLAPLVMTQAVRSQEPGPGVLPALPFSPITFCLDVTDGGDCLEPSDHFPSGTYTVWAYFTYHSMQDGMAWGRVWTQYGEIYIDARGERWEDGESGWVAYSITEEDTPLRGHYTLSLYLGDDPIQADEFEVDYQHPEDIGGQPAFGPVQFASGVSDDNLPIDPAGQFDFGLSQVYASFAYANLPVGQSWGFEWLCNGEILTWKERQWDDWPDGVTYLTLYAEEGGLYIGDYTFNLYLDGELSRSAGFEIISHDTPEVRSDKTPEELIDPDLLPAYEMLRNSDMELLYRLADQVIDYEIELRIVDSLDSAVAVYSYDPSTCEVQETGARQAGDVLVSRQFWNDHSWEEVAAVVAHELTHAFQHIYTGLPLRRL